MNCEVCKVEPLCYHPGLWLMGHLTIGDLVHIPKGVDPGMYYVCSIIPNDDYRDRTNFRGSYFCSHKEWISVTTRAAYDAANDRVRAIRTQRGT